MTARVPPIIGLADVVGWLGLGSCCLGRGTVVGEAIISNYHLGIKVYPVKNVGLEKNLVRKKVLVRKKNLVRKKIGMKKDLVREKFLS